MSITKELREWARSHVVHEAERIADRIDEAHEKAIGKLEMRSVSDCGMARVEGIAQGIKEESERIADGFGEHYIELPKDRNGKKIHISDTVRLGNDEATVCGIGKESVFVFTEDANLYPDGGKHYIAWNQINLELIEPDTQEKIYEDCLVLLDAPCTYFCKNPKPDCVSNPRECSLNALKDLLSRQRRLDGME